MIGDFLNHSKNLMEMKWTLEEIFFSPTDPLVEKFPEDGAEGQFLSKYNLQKHCAKKLELTGQVDH